MNPLNIRTLILGALLTVLFTAGYSHDLLAMDVKEIESARGVHAWLAENHKLPLITLHFAFRGGVEEDPVDKQGLSDLTMALLSQGAGDLDAPAFQQALADHAVQLGFSASRDALYGSIKCLREERATAFDLIAMALTKPQFDGKELERVRARQGAALRYQLGDPEWQVRYALFQKVFGNHPYGLRHLGTLKTLAAIRRVDVTSFAAHHFARDNLVVAAAGDITPAELSEALDMIFGSLPAHAKREDIRDVVYPSTASLLLTEREGTQTDVLFALPGPKRDDPDWYASEIANYILGGGGFSSRLMHEVRDKNGLTYGISTGLSAMEHSSLIVGEAATDNGKTGKAWDLIKETMQNLVDDGVTAEEVTAAKDYLIGSMPLALTSTDKIAGLLVDLQLDHRPSDYLERRRELLKAVREEDINRALRHWFSPGQLWVSMVGKPEGVIPTETRALVHE